MFGRPPGTVGDVPLPSSSVVPIPPPPMPSLSQTVGLANRTRFTIEHYLHQGHSFRVRDEIGSVLFLVQMDPTSYQVVDHRSIHTRYLIDPMGQRLGFFRSIMEHDFHTGHELLDNWGRAHAAGDVRRTRMASAFEIRGWGSGGIPIVTCSGKLRDQGFVISGQDGKEVARILKQAGSRAADTLGVLMTGSFDPIIPLVVALAVALYWDRPMEGT